MISNAQAKFETYDAKSRRAAPVAGLPLASDFLNHFSQIAMALEALDQAPHLAQDIRRWRPRSYHEHVRDNRLLALIDASQTLHPITRRAFIAVVEGLNALGLEASGRCRGDNEPLGPDEFPACQALAAAMKGLLERAMALVESAEGNSPRSAQDRADRAFAGVAPAETV